LVRHHSSPLSPEARIRQGLERVPFDDLWDTVTHDVVPAAALLVVLALATWALDQRWWRGVATGLAVPLTVAVVDLVLKPVFGRRELGSGVLQYPSGHVAGTTATVVVVLVLLGPQLRTDVARWVLAAAGAGLCAFMVVGVIVSNMHWAVDAVAGVPTGLAVALGWCLLVDAVGERISRCSAGSIEPGRHHVR
jgi:membrane-associated phospholipid phosphatase